MFLTQTWYGPRFILGLYWLYVKWNFRFWKEIT
jgi:hypothetical protein